MTTSYSPWSGTFQWWEKYPPGKVKQIPIKEYANYESSYVRWFNYIKDRGWYREGGEWRHEDDPMKFKRVYDAYQHQKFRDEVIKNDS